jgi:deoxyadenosine/deoxycytidine kinase
MARLIAVVGNSGVGKTSLVRKLCAAAGYRHALEQHAARPYQQRFAGDLARYALANQLDFLLFRAEQERDLRGDRTIGIVDGGLDLDYYGFTRLFHRRGYLDDDAFALCTRQYTLLRALLPPPDLYIHLVAPLAVIADRHARRNRTLEITAQQDLAELDLLVNEWMAAVPPPQKIVVDAARSSFSSAGALAILLQEIQLRLTL